MILVQRGGCRAVLSETPAGRAWGPSVRCGEGGHRHRGPELQNILQRGDLCGSQANFLRPYTEKNGSGSGSCASGCAEKPGPRPAEGLPGQQKWRRFCSWWLVCNWSRKTGYTTGAQGEGIWRQS